MSSLEEESALRIRLEDKEIPFDDIVAATKNFAEENILKQGTIADVYKGRLFWFKKWMDVDVVIRRFRRVDGLTKSIFLKEIHTLSILQHRNIVSIVGFCDENDERMIIMEHAVNGSLDKYLNDVTLTWPQRLQICVGASLALRYIHNHIEGTHDGFHHDIRSSKILLDENWKAKVFCFGFKVPYSVVFYNTTSYTDPIYTKIGYGTHKSDVYSLGVILLEVLCARKVSINDVSRYIAQMGQNDYEEGELVDIIDPNLRKQMHRHSQSICLEIVYNCLKKQLEQRPDMNQIVERLQEALEIQLRHENLVRNFAYLKIQLNNIKLATNDFDCIHRIKSNNDEMVYRAQLDLFDKENVLTTEGENKGELSKKTVIIKRFINKNCEKLRNEFFAEIEMLSSGKHPNLLTLLGFCDEDSETILVFDGAFKGFLHDYLGRTSEGTKFTWEQRIHICLDIAHGLKYLFHNLDDKSRMTYQRIQSANVLLDKNWTAKIANFGITEFDDSHSRTIDTNNIGGTNMYLDSESLMSDIYTPLSKESNHIYSLGVILFEILTGKLVNVKGLASISSGQWRVSAGTLKNMADPNIMEEAQECSYALRKGPNPNSLDIFSRITYQCLVEIPSKRPTLEVVIKSLEKALHFQVHLEHLKIPFDDIQLATENFNKKHLLGSGGYGAVYQAYLNTFDSRSYLETQEKSTNELPKMHNKVAIKRIFSREDDQGKEGFLSELDVLSRCVHPNIVSLLGFCVEGNEMLLVFEHASNGSLDTYLGRTNKMINLTWTQRLNICIDIANGLNYLHTTFEDKKWIVHRDIKSDNILLDKNWQAKIADFGFSKFHTMNQQESTINTSNIAGTKVYLDPEYARTHRLKRASDIYSFGVVLFELFSGTLAYDSNYTSENINGLAPIAQRHFENGTLIKEILDPKIKDEAHELGCTLKVGPCHDSLIAFSRIAYRCLAKAQAERPTIEEVIQELQAALKFQENRKDTFKLSLEDFLGGGNFSDENFILRGGYWKLYRGELQYNSVRKKVLVKQFSKLGHEHGFLREFEVLFKHKQENIIGLVGYCRELDEKIIVYENANEECLSSHLNKTSFSWNTRLKICIDIAKGLNFLHGGDVGQDVVIHGDLKSSNILITKDWKAKICGFELSLTYSTNQELEYVVKDAVGSPGYCDPLYQETHILTKESDIYSFGVILFEILCGRMACPRDFRNNSQFLDELVKCHFKVARVDEIVFEGIKEQIVLKSLATFRNIAFRCLREDREERPSAGEVVAHLQKALEFQEAYEIWEAKLPRNYKEILQLSKSSEIYSTMGKKDIHNILSKGILLKDDKLWFSIADNGERNEMITARMFSFRNRWSHRWRSIQTSRFPKVAEMLDISNLNIQIKIRPQLLPSDVKYSVHLVFKFCGPRKSHAERVYVNLKYKMRNENLNAYFATWREDDWMMIELCRFSNLKKDTNFEVLLEGFSRCYCDSRAIYIEGMEFRAIDNVKQEKMKKKEIQQVRKSSSKLKLKEDHMVWNPLSKMTRKVYNIQSAKGGVYHFSNVTRPHSKLSAQSRVEWMYKVPRRQVICIEWHIKEYQVMSSNTGTTCYLVFKLSKNSCGLHCPVIVRDLFQRKTKKIIYFRSPSPWNLHDTDEVPKKRIDGWMEVIVSKFNSDFVLKKGCLYGKLKLISSQGTMFGLIIRGVEFRPNKLNLSGDHSICRSPAPIMQLIYGNDFDGSGDIPIEIKNKSPNIQALYERLMNRPNPSEDISVIADPGIFDHDKLEFWIDPEEIKIAMKYGWLNINIITWFEIMLDSTQQTLNGKKCAFINPNVISERLCVEDEDDVTSDILQAMQLHHNKSIFLAPYLESGVHWVLFVFLPHKPLGYILDSFNSTKTVDSYKLKNIIERAVVRYEHDNSSSSGMRWTLAECNQQNSGWECGYYVMKWMYDFVMWQQDDFPMRDIWNDKSSFPARMLENMMFRWISNLLSGTTGTRRLQSRHLLEFMYEFDKFNDAN